MNKKSKIVENNLCSGEDPSREMVLSNPAAWTTVDGKIDESSFARCFLASVEMKYLDGQLITVNGVVRDEDRIRSFILEQVEDFVTSNLPKTVDRLLETIKLMALTRELPMRDDLIHLKNGTMDTNGVYVPSKFLCRNRLPVSYKGQLDPPAMWLAFLDELLEEEDIMTLQEFIGYCLIPTNKAQRMLMILGEGGEGKSRVGVVMQALFGENMSMGSLMKVETNRFARADLQGKLLMVDDDMQLGALPSTGNLKTLITAEGKQDLECKGRQSHQGVMYCRFLAFGNGGLTALHDRSHGFYRRQLILTAKPRDPNRKDEPTLAQDIIKYELNAVYIWALEGLMRLAANNYRFTLSLRARENLARAMREGNNILDFLEDGNAVTLDPGCSATTRELCRAYRAWCEDNSLHAVSDRTLSGFLQQNQRKYRLQYVNRVESTGPRAVRGFRGVGVKRCIP